MKFHKPKVYRYKIAPQDDPVLWIGLNRYNLPYKQIIGAYAVIHGYCYCIKWAKPD